MGRKLKKISKTQARMGFVSVITIAALVCGVLSIIASANGDFYNAGKLIMLGMILDGLDGTCARWLKAESAFGAELDTFVDLTCFGVAPAMLAYFAALNEMTFMGIRFGVILACAIVMSGAMRLARFKVIDPDHGQNGYTGMPITANAACLALLVMTAESPVWFDPPAWFVSIQKPDWLNLTEGPFAWFMWINCIAGLILQVSTIRYAKPTRRASGQMIGILMFLGLFIHPVSALVATLGWLLPYGFFYSYIQPFITARQQQGASRHV